MHAFGQKRTLKNRSTHIIGARHTDDDHIPFTHWQLNRICWCPAIVLSLVIISRTRKSSFQGQDKPFLKVYIVANNNYVVNYKRNKMSDSHKKYKPLIFLKALLDSMDYPVIAICCDEKITFLNSKIRSLLEKRDDQIFGKEFSKVFTLFSENGSRIEIPFDRILVKGEAEEFNGVNLKISKEKTRVVDIVISPFKILANKVIGSVLIIRDVSEFSMSREEKGATLEVLIDLIQAQSISD